MEEYKVFSIGSVKETDSGICIQMKPAYRAALLGLAGYSHVQVLWWADGCDNEKGRNALVEEKPYKRGPEKLGVFATRSPQRPNPICVSNVEISYADTESGRVGVYYLDAFPGSSVLDLKPYTPSIDRVKHPKTPDWCSHWPKSYEESGEFDWESEFNF